jgi:hypothetical protein
MRVVELNRKPVEIKNLIKRSALESDTTKVISEPAIFTENGKVVMVYGKIHITAEGGGCGRIVEEIRNACKTIKYEKSDRTGGLKSESRIFGFKPRRVIRGDYCSSTQLGMQYPKEHAAIANFGVLFTRLYDTHAPDVFRNHFALVHSEVRPEWVIPGTVFTSGIINKNNQLKYHLDSGNFKDCMSCMLVLRRDTEGGMLSLPEFDLRLDLQDSTYLIFDGQSILHGVTPINKLNKNSYRYTLVYYALQQMCRCLAPEEELKRIRSLKKQREEKRLDKNRTDL